MKYVIFWFIAGVILGLRLFQSFVMTRPFQVGQSITFKIRLLDEPKIRYNKQIIQYKNVQISLPLNPAFHYGDVLLINGKVSKQSSVSSRNNPRPVLNEPRVLVLPKGVVFTLFSGMRKHISMTFNQSLSSRESGLLQGIVFGIKDGIDSSTYTKFKNVGLLHIVAASGANISILSVILLTTIGVLLHRKWGLVATGTVIIAYTVFAGLQPSIIRAALMAMIALTAGLTGRQNFALTSLGISAFIMLMINPELVGDVGFQLSCAATGGILVIKPRLDNLIPSSIPGSLTTDITTTLAAQIATLPILLSAFGSFSPVSLLTNLAVLWMIPILMIVGGVAALTSYIFPFLTHVILYCIFPLLVYFFFVVEKFSSIAYQLHVDSLPLWFTAGYYCLLIALLSIRITTPGKVET